MPFDIVIQCLPRHVVPYYLTTKLSKKIYDCPMDRPISVAFSDIYVCKVEQDIVMPEKVNIIKTIR